MLISNLTEQQMERDRRKVLVLAAARMITATLGLALAAVALMQELIDSSESSDEDDEILEVMESCRNTNLERYVQKIINYVEEIILVLRKSF